LKGRYFYQPNLGRGFALPSGVGIGKFVIRIWDKR